MSVNLSDSQNVDDRTATVASLGHARPPIWLEGGSAILNPSGGILEINTPLRSWLENSGDDDADSSFWDILAKISPEWTSPLLQLAQDTDPFASIDLTLAGGPHQSDQTFRLEVARAQQCIFVRLSSIRPPSNLPSGAKIENSVHPFGSKSTFGILSGAGANGVAPDQHWPCIVFIQQPDFGLQFASANIKELTGLGADDWCSHSDRFWEVVHESDAPNLRRQFKHAAQTKDPITNAYRIRHAHTGRVAYILEHRQPVVSANGLLLGYEVAWLDVTRQTIAERRLAAAAWKETLAVLTLGMAHDFTNVIAGIHSLSESFLAQMDGQHAFYEGMSLIKKSSMQASQLVHRMVSLHLGQIGERNYHDLNDIARDMVDLVKKILPRRVQLATELSEGQLPVYLDLVEFRQAVINLILNAADAMPRGGQLTLRTSRHEEQPVLENMKGTAPRLPCVCLTVQDTGSGIKQRHLAAIFDPFFTTKAKGSGLGLYNARLAVEKLHGAISVVSSEGKGTKFQIWLPEADFSEASRLETAAHGKRPARRTLLLLGPAGEMLDKTAELLRSHNYYIVIAPSSDQPFEMLRSPDYLFDGVFMLTEPWYLSSGSLPTEACQRDKHIKLILKLTAGQQDDLDTQLLTDADLVLGAELSEMDSLTKLKQFFDQNG